MKNQQNHRDMSTVWIVNEHGVKSSKPRWMAEELLEKHRKWDYCEPENVPKKKGYPVSGGQLTEQGLNRRSAAGVTVEGEDPEDREPTFREMVQMAKRRGINTYKMKKDDVKDALDL